MIALTIEAADTLFFRDGRPFTMGEDTHAGGLFPPPPSVIYGALRSAYISENLSKGKTLDDLISDSDALTIKNLWIDIDCVPHFPLPKDLVVPKGTNPKAFPLLLTKKPTLSNIQTPRILLNELDGKMQEADFWLRFSEMNAYLSNSKTENFPCLKLPILSENKIGIGRQNDTHIANEGMLYRTQLHRLEDEKEKKTRIGIQFDKLSINTEGVLQLGGERKVAFTSNTPHFSFAFPELDSEYFKIYLSTPAIFRTGWQPTKMFKDYGLELIAAATGKPLPIGGWDVKERIPKAMLQAVSAGSVYYVKAESKAKADEAAKAIHEQSISDYLGKQGFGIALVGKIYPKL
jgi:CRISPR-associated protein Cmr3